jgi:hypothetical protein
MLAQRVAPAPRQLIVGAPQILQFGLWLGLVLVFAGPVVLVLGLPVAAGLWRLETSRGNRFAPWPWLRHLCEMTVAMYAGMLLYMAVAGPVVTSLLGNGSAGGALRYAGMVLSMILPMVALMRIEGHSWRMAQEMTLAMVAPIVLCFALLGLGVCQLVPFLAWLTPASVYGAAHDGMLLGMVALMAVRRGMYGGGTTAPQAARVDCAAAH